MTFRGIQTRVVDLPAAESRTVPMAGRHLSVAEAYNTDYTSKTRPVVAIKMQSQDAPAELIADARQGDQFEAHTAFDQIELTNLTASAIRVTLQTSSEPIDRDPPRLPVIASPWIIADSAETVYHGAGTLAAAGDNVIIVPSSAITLDRVARTVLLLKVTAGALRFGTDFGVISAYSLASNDPPLVFENVTDLQTYTRTAGTEYEWTLLVTGVIER